MALAVTTVVRIPLRTAGTAAVGSVGCTRVVAAGGDVEPCGLEVPTDLCSCRGWCTTPGHADDSVLSGAPVNAAVLGGGGIGGELAGGLGARAGSDPAVADTVAGVGEAAG
jgi:hypothetical protein